MRPTLRALASAVALMLLAIGPAKSMPLNFEFSFTNGADIVRGMINGLEDNARGNPAEVIVTSSPIPDTEGSYQQEAGTFNVLNGMIADAFYSGICVAVCGGPLTTVLSFDTNAEPQGFLGTGTVARVSGDGLSFAQIGGASIVPTGGEVANVPEAPDTPTAASDNRTATGPASTPASGENGTENGVSHTAVIPVPASVLLLLTALVGIGLLHHLRRTAA